MGMNLALPWLEEESRRISMDMDGGLGRLSSWWEDLATESP